MAVTVVIRDGRAIAAGDLDSRLLEALTRLEGGRRWLKSGAYSFEATPMNLEVFRAAYPEAAIEALEINTAKATDVSTGRRSPTPYRPLTKPYGHQERALAKALPEPAFALFLEMGTGKTKIAIDKAGTLWCDGKLSGVLVVGMKGPHEQWVDEQVPAHLGEMVPRVAHAWDRKDLPKALFKTDKLAFFCINIDALKTEKGEAAARRFIAAHKGHVMMIVDESQTIKNYRAQRTKKCYELGKLCDYRLIMTGSPIARDLTDYWAQFKFLNEGIIGHRYKTSFRAQYCRMGGFQNRMVVGHKNIEQLYSRIEPYTFRVTKEEELDLPPKVYDRFRFTMSDEQQRAYSEMTDSFLTQLDSGEISSVAIAATLLIRLQQITCGYLPSDDGSVHAFEANPRLEALMNVIAAREGKMIIWARFKHDIETIMTKLGGEAVAYWGGVKSTKARGEAKEKFLDADSGIRFFVSNPQAGGVGLNLQGDCRTAIYYSNSFNALDRWQSEDRIHRIGTTGAVTYIDLVCKGSVDAKILTNLRNKKSLSDLVLDDIRKIVAG